MSEESGVEQQPDVTGAEQTQQQKMADIDTFLQGGDGDGAGDNDGGYGGKGDGVSGKHKNKTSAGEGEGGAERGDSSEKKGGEGEGGESGGAEKEDETPADIAEKKRRIELYKQTVNMPSDQESVTVGELKDEVIEHRNSVQAIVDRENSVMRQFGHLMKIKQAMPQLTAEQTQAMNDFEQINRNKQSALLLQAIPDWSNQQTFATDKSSMVSMLQDYGITESDLDAVTDHRLLKLAYDFDRLKKRLSTAGQSNKDAQKKTTEGRKKTTQKGTGHKQPTSKSADFDSTKRSVNVADQMQQVSALFDGLK